MGADPTLKMTFVVNTFQAVENVVIMNELLSQIINSTNQ